MNLTLFFGVMILLALSIVQRLLSKPSCLMNVCSIVKVRYYFYFS